MGAVARGGGRGRLGAAEEGRAGGGSKQAGLVSATHRELCRGTGGGSIPVSVDCLVTQRPVCTVLFTHVASDG